MEKQIGGWTDRQMDKWTNEKMGRHKDIFDYGTIFYLLSN